MKRSLNVLAGITLSSILLWGCSADKSSSSGSSSVTTGFTMTGSGQNATVAQTKLHKLFSLFVPSAIALTPPAIVDLNNTPVSLSEAWIVIEEIEFEAEEVAGAEETDGDEVKFEGPFYVDLLSDAPESLGNAAIPASGIKRIKMQLHESEDGALPAGAPAGLDSKSIFFSGTVGGVSFTYAADDSTEYEISGSNPIVPKSSQDLLAVIRTADLFKKIDMSSITTATDITSSNRVTVANACPSIDATANDLYTCFRKGLSSEANFGNDDGDKDLDENDETVEDESAE